jgi:putative ABC transport system substrate-binding protein
VLVGANAESDAPTQANIAAFREDLAKLGWHEERNLRLDLRYGGGNADRILTYAVELVRLSPDVIVAGTRAAILALQQQSRTIPIVITGAGDVAANGLVKNVARPEANITGVTNLFGSIGGKWLELLKEAVPSLKRVSFIESQFAIEGRISSYSPSIEETARVLSVQTIDIHYRSNVELVRAIDAFAATPDGGLIVGPATTVADRQAIRELAAQHRLPAIHADREFAAQGGLMSYGSYGTDQWRRASFYVDRILRGAKVSELPVEYPTKFRLVINVKAAKALGLTISEAFLLRADELIE